jgi:hypothetical protein
MSQKPIRMLNRRLALALLAPLIALAVSDLPRAVARPSGAAPSRLSDAEFWRLASEFSEPDGSFHSENLVSNEARFQAIVPALVQAAAPGRAYVGVGSEQNYTYIAATRPAIAFIVDIRRGNFDLHLAYKALFELSANRAEFVSRLFSRPRPPGLELSSTATEIFDAFATVAPTESLREQNLRAIIAHLTKTHAFALDDGDRAGIEYVHRAWFTSGPAIQYQLNGGGRGGQFPTYADLMTATDDRGVNRSFLASDENFRFIKDLHTRNLIVPVVGNFGGSKALRAVAAYLKRQGTVVSAFYTSNVEQYLQRDGLWATFCASAATMPLDNRSVLIRSSRGGFGGFSRGLPGGGFFLELIAIAPEMTACAAK